MVSSGSLVACHSKAPSVITQAAVARTWDRPRSARNCVRAPSRSAGLSNHSSPATRIWSAPITKTPGLRADTVRAFSTARASAQDVAVSPVTRASRLIRASSIAAGSISNRTPAAHSKAARAELADARITGSGITGSGIEALAALIQLVDCRGGLLDGTPGHVDHRPVMLSKDTPSLTDLGADRLDIGVIRGFVVIEHAEAVAS